MSLLPLVNFLILYVAQSKLETCSESTWKLVQNGSFSTGHAKLQFKIDKVNHLLSTSFQ